MVVFLFHIFDFVCLFSHPLNFCDDFSVMCSAVRTTQIYFYHQGTQALDIIHTFMMLEIFI